MEFWQDCANTFHEEEKQLIYASRMGLYALKNCAHPPTFDLGGRSVVDIGGGPVSLLLKCMNKGEAMVVDPGDYPNWVQDRYFSCGIDWKRVRAEAILDERSWDAGWVRRRTWDEAWIYNTLQHVDDPSCVVHNALVLAKTVRIFEWIDIPAYEGHPHELRRDDLDRWLGGMGYVTQLNESGAVGTAYYGVFSRKEKHEG